MSTAGAFPVTTAPLTSPPTAPHRARSVGAVAGGLFAIFAVTTATDLALHAAGVLPAYGQPHTHAPYVLAAAYRILFGIGGSYLTARLAPSRHLGHALVLGGIGTALAVIGAIVMWDAGPAWYALAVIAMSLPCAGLGGQLALRGR